MSVNYSFDFELNADISKPVIEKIIDSLHEKKCLFLSYDEDCVIGKNEAVNISMKKVSSDEEDVGPLVLKYLDTYIFLYFVKNKKNKLNVDFYTSGGIWKKLFRNRGDIDLDTSRYLLFITELLDGFDVVGMKFVIHY
jgi:hypothetical protein